MGSGSLVIVVLSTVRELSASLILCRLTKNDVIDSIRLQIVFFSTNIYTSKECNISFERAQNILSRRKKVVFMEANNIFKKILKSLKIDKNNSQNLAQQKKL